MRTEHHYHDLPAADRASMADLVTDLGHDPDVIAAAFAVEHTDDACLLHLTEFLLDGQGRRYIDPATDDIASRDHAIPVDPQRLPATLNRHSAT